MSVIASTDINNTNDDVLFDRRTLEKLQKVDIEELSYNESDHAELDDFDPHLPAPVRFGRQMQENDDGDHELPSDPEERRLVELEMGLAQYYKQKKDYNIDVDRQLAKKERKRERLIEQQRLKKEDISEEEALENDDINVEDADGEPKKRGVKIA